MTACGSTDTSVPADFFPRLEENIAHFARIKDPGCELGINFVVSARNAHQVYDAARFFRGTSAPQPDWTAVGFDDSSWESGATAIGYGEDDIATVLADMEEDGANAGYLSFFTRQSFTLTADDLATGHRSDPQPGGSSAAGRSCTARRARAPDLGGGPGATEPMRRENARLVTRKSRRGPAPALAA